MELEVVRTDDDAKAPCRVAGGAGANIKDRYFYSYDKYGEWTPLHKASRNGQVGVVEALLAHDADPDVKDDDGLKPLHVAGQETVVRTIITNGADPSAKAKNAGSSMTLHYASNSSQIDVVKMLLSHDADANAKQGSVLSSKFYFILRYLAKKYR